MSYRIDFLHIAGNCYVAINLFKGTTICYIGIYVSLSSSILLVINAEV